jgi:hypothetical protein
MDMPAIIGTGAMLLIIGYEIISEYIRMRRDDPFKEENIDSK